MPNLPQELPNRRLFKPPSLDESTLAERQQLALSLIDGHAGVLPEDLGRALGSSGRWARRTGWDVLRALRKKGLVKRRRADGLWVRVGALVESEARGTLRTSGSSATSGPDSGSTSAPYNEFPPDY